MDDDLQCKEQEVTVVLNDYDDSHDDVTNILNEQYKQMNHTHFQKYIGLNRYFVCLFLSFINPRKRVFMYSKQYISRFVVPFMKNVIIIVYNEQNKVVKIRYNTIKKIE